MDPLVTEALKIVGSIIAGVAVAQFLRRRMPYVSVVSIKPSGTTQMRGYSAQIGDDLLKTINAFHWGGTSLDRDLQRTEDLSTFHEVLRCAKLFQVATDNSRSVLDRLIAELEKPTRQTEELKSLLATMMSDRIIARTLQGSTKRGTIQWNNPPANLNTAQLLIPMEVEDFAGLMGGVQGRVLLPFSSFMCAIGFDDPSERRQMIAFCYAIASPDHSRLLDNLKVARHEIIEDLSRAVKIDKSLEEIVLNQSRWIINIQVTNLGQSPIVVSREATLEARSGNKIYPPIKLSNHSSEEVKGTSEKKPQSEADLRNFGVTLPPGEGTNAANSFVAPGASVVLHLVSQTAVGTNQDGRDILAFWQKQISEFRVTLKLVPERKFVPNVKSRWGKV